MTANSELSKLENLRNEYIEEAIEHEDYVMHGDEEAALFAFVDEIVSESTRLTDNPQDPTHKLYPDFNCSAMTYTPLLTWGVIEDMHALITVYTRQLAAIANVWLSVTEIKRLHDFALFLQITRNDEV